jgi:endonuclease YncB( thermonuclease family)
MNVVCSLVVVAIAVLAFAPTLAAQDSCKLSAMGNVNVAGIRDGRTLVLADGRELRLAGIETGDASRAALEALAAGRSLRLEKLRAENDRYGRVVAFAFEGEMQTSLQQALIEQGQARVSSRVGDRVALKCFWRQSARHARPAAACGQTPISPLYGHTMPPALRLFGVSLPWLKARSCRCGKAAPQYI